MYVHGRGQFTNVQHVLTLFCQLQQTTLSKVGTNSCKAFFDMICWKRYPCLASVLKWHQGLNCTVTLLISWFSQGKMYRCDIIVPYPPSPLPPEKWLYISSLTIFVLYLMRNDLLRFTFYWSCKVKFLETAVMIK